MRRPPRCSLAALIGLLVCSLLTAACASSAARVPRPVDPRLPVELASGGTAPLSTIDVDPSLPLHQRFDAVRQRLEERGHRVVLPGDARAWLRMKYLTWRTTHPGGSVLHLAVVLDDPWDDEADAVFVDAFHHLPSQVLDDGAVRRFHVFGPPTGAPAWFFSNAWYGGLESALWVAFSELPWSEAAVPLYLERVTQILLRFGLVPDGTPTPAELDVAFERLREHRALGYRPLASIAAIALLAGHHATSLDPQLRWRLGSDVQATLFGLQLETHGPNAVLRPVDYLLAAWNGDRDAVVQGYLRVVEERLAAR